MLLYFFFQAEDGIRDLVRSRGLGDVYKRQEFYKPEKGRYLHPEQHRPITHREAARIQTFPDDFVFKGTKIEIAKQIGNAVPPLLGEAVAGCIDEMLSAL